ncbi:right-handed parallel beta-helix repeat-containing protein [Sphingobacterium sp. UME9]|uniref:right-handed parallel beta-helix repeat-containing protein n=1 Tax=Sphingobacterium sp. UME9 TaxID=1862316 RepID=UPI0016040825|nr:right-handed parallel beta-helix repeat-containing protein [Sphingobacterium sp. UME9]MBB1643045.1 hypothetical protein [Sphingobacterium sp. UME9]
MTNQFLIKNTMADMRGLSACEITLLQSGCYAGVELLGYYEKGDTPAPIIYYLAPTTPDPGSDNGGSLIEIAGIKLIHRFVGTADIRYFGAAPQNLDNTTFIQKCIDTVQINCISIDNNTYKVLGSINLKSALKIQGDTSLITKTGSQTVALFVGTAVSEVEIDGIRLHGGFDPAKPNNINYAGLLFSESSNLIITNVSVEKFSVGIRLYYCDNVEMSLCTITDNNSIGISGLANNAKLKNSFIQRNGNDIPAASQQTRDIYLINSSNLEIFNNTIGNSIDPLTRALAVRYDADDLRTDFDKVENISIQHNRFQNNGVGIGSDPGLVATQRIPPVNVILESNDFTGTADVWIDDVFNARTQHNIGIVNYNVRIGTSKPFSLYSFNDETQQVNQNSLSGNQTVARDAIVFDKTNFTSTTGFAFNTVSGYGGLPACTIKSPKSKVPLFDTSFSSRFVAGNVLVEDSFRPNLSNRNYFDYEIVNSSSFTPNNISNERNPFFIRVDTVGVLNITAPSNSKNGAELEFILLNFRPTGQMNIAFSAEYDLSENTKRALAGLPYAKFIFLKFRYLRGVWREEVNNYFFNKSSAVANISNTNLSNTTATDVAGLVSWINSDLIPLVNANKTQLNAKLESDRASGQQSS